MKARVRRLTSLALCSALCGGLSLVVVAGTSSSAGATSPPLTVTPTTTLNFGSVTLGDVAGPEAFTLTNTGSVNDVISTVNTTATGPGANDYFALPDTTSCPAPDLQGNITLTPTSSCTLDTFFLPGALGPRDATVNISDSQSSGVTVPLNGVGTIGYYQVSTKGTVANFGDAGFFGDLTGTPLNKPIVGIAQTGDDGGYWLAASDGGIFNFGDAGFFGSAGGIKLNKPVVGIAPTIDGEGYWLVATDGGIFNYGDAPFYGSSGSIALNKPIVGMAATPDGNGYWLVASDGGIFAYGDAQFYGSTGSIHLTQPIVSMAAMPDGGGYWFTAADGGLFNYGTAPFLGASAGTNIGTVVGMATDGAPTLQAFFDLSGERGHASGSVPLVRPLPANVRHFAGG
jgi:hypothetical protein